MSERRYIIVPVPLTVKEYEEMRSRATLLAVNRPTVTSAIRDLMRMAPEPYGFQQSSAKHLFEGEYRREKENGRG